MSPLVVMMDLWGTVKAYEISLVMDEMASDTDTGDESEGAAAVGKALKQLPPEVSIALLPGVSEPRKRARQEPEKSLPSHNIERSKHQQSNAGDDSFLSTAELDRRPRLEGDEDSLISAVETKKRSQQEAFQLLAPTAINYKQPIPTAGVNSLISGLEANEQPQQELIEFSCPAMDANDQTTSETPEDPLMSALEKNDQPQIDAKFAFATPASEQNKQLRPEIDVALLLTPEDQLPRADQTLDASSLGKATSSTEMKQKHANVSQNVVSTPINELPNLNTSLGRQSQDSESTVSSSAELNQSDRSENSMDWDQSDGSALLLPLDPLYNESSVMSESFSQWSNAARTPAPVAQLANMHTSSTPSPAEQRKLSTPKAPLFADSVADNSSTKKTRLSGS